MYKFLVDTIIKSIVSYIIDQRTTELEDTKSMMFDDILMDDLDDELSEKEKNLYLLTSISMCHTKKTEQGAMNGGTQKYNRE